MSTSSPLRSAPPTPIKVPPVAQRSATIKETNFLLLLVSKHLNWVDVAGQIGIKPAVAVQKQFFELKESLRVPDIDEVEDTADEEMVDKFMQVASPKARVA